MLLCPEHIFRTAVAADAAATVLAEEDQSVATHTGRHIDPGGRGFSFRRGVMAGRQGRGDKLFLFEKAWLVTKRWGVVCTCS